MLVIFDTNVLLNFYTFPRNIVEKLLKILDDNFEICITNRVYVEYTRDKDQYLKNKKKQNLITVQEKDITESIKAISDGINRLKKKNFNHFNTSYKKIVEEMEKQLQEKKSEINIELKKCKDEYIENEFDEDNDPICEFVKKHYVKKKYSKKEELDVVIEYDSRAKSGIGPGKTDFNKNPLKDDPFVRAGDYFIWKETIEIANNSDEKSVCFVTFEKKTDFWDDFESRTFSRYLLEEFSELTDGKAFNPYSFHDFCEEQAYDYIKEDVELTGFLLEKRKEYDEIFKEKSFIENELDPFYDFGYKELCSHLGDSLDGANINDLDDIEIQDVTLLGDLKSIELDYYSDSDEIHATLPLSISGQFEATMNYGHFDGDEVNEYHTVDFEMTIDADVSYYFDGDSVCFNRIIKIDEKSFDMQAEYESEDEIPSGNTCIICGCELNDYNTRDGVTCESCYFSEDDE